MTRQQTVITVDRQP